MSVAIKMVTYQEELKLLTEKINAMKSQNKVLDDFKACAHAQKNDAAEAKAKAEAEAKAKAEDTISCSTLLYEVTQPK